MSSSPADSLHITEIRPLPASRSPVAELRGYARLAVDATLGVTGIVETMHHNIVRVPGILGRATEHPTRGITGLVYASIRGVTQLVGGGIDLLSATDLVPTGGGWAVAEREAAASALNGVVGDYLAATQNPLAIEMQYRRHGKPLPPTRAGVAAMIPAATRRILVLIHGLSMNDRHWRWRGHDHGVALAEEAGYTPVYLRYNSGLHISQNGRRLADQLAQLLSVWPVEVDEIAILGYSMGGLVARSAVHLGAQSGAAWRARVHKLVCLGSPHHGAPLERGGAWLHMVAGISPYTVGLARLGKVRSAGITDLRYGNVADDDWRGRDRFRAIRDQRRHVPLPHDVDCYALAACRAPTPAHPRAGDGLVPVRSALGEHPDPRRQLAFPPDNRWVGTGMHHLDLLHRREVYERLRHWLA